MARKLYTGVNYNGKHGIEQISQGIGAWQKLIAGLVTEGVAERVTFRQGDTFVFGRDARHSPVMLYEVWGDVRPANLKRKRSAQ